jgi:Transposase DNA-binding
MQDWTDMETATANISVKRLNARFRIVLDKMSQKSSLKFPAACHARAEFAGAYRSLGEPGPKAMWVGLQRLTDIAEGSRAAKDHGPIATGPRFQAVAETPTDRGVQERKPGRRGLSP